MERIILHCDLNNFYASVECLYNPAIREKPVAVCGSQSTRHGIVLAKNQIAKKLGVRSAEAVWEARSKCPDLVVVPPNYALYLKFSAMAIKIYRRYTSLVEPFGIDECWLDVTASTGLFGSGTQIAEEIRRTIKDELGITASIGVSFNKIFAKLGSDMQKPDIVTEVDAHNFKHSVWNLPVSDLMYVGRSTKNKLNKVGILTIGDLASSPRKLLHELLGQWGETLWAFANGFDTTPVMPTYSEPVIKGVGNSLTTPRDLTCNEDVHILIYVLADSVGERLRKHHLKGRTVQICIRDQKLGCMERQAKLGTYTDISSEIAQKAYEIFLHSWDWSRSIRSLGVRVTDLVTAESYIQLSLLSDDRRTKRQLLDSSVDSIRKRFGHYSVQRALLLRDRGLNANPAEENIIHPVSYFK